MNETPSDALKAQCKQQWERCLYTSNTLLIWLRTLRKLRIGFIIAPIIFGTLASWDLISSNDRFKVVTAILALVAGLVPAIYAALKLDEHMPTAARLAGEYKNLEILFKDLGRIGPHKAFPDFEAEYKEARERLEAANKESYTAPEWCFNRARAKIEKGDYRFEEDNAPAKV